MKLVRLLPAGARGPRILLRPVRLTDAEALFAAVEFSRSRIRRTVPWSPGIRTLGDMRRRVRKIQADGRLGHEKRYALVERSTRAVVGSCMLGLGQRKHGTGMAGAWMRHDRWGRGYGSETAILLCHIGFERLGLERVEFLIGPRNKRSRAVPECLGIPLEGILRNHWREAGKLVSSAVYAVIRSDMRRLAPRWRRRLRAYARDA